MNGPAAPKDPEKKRPYFYILKDKEIFGAKQPDGSAIHFIYESDGRLINSAQIVGNKSSLQTDRRRYGTSYISVRLYMDRG